MKSSSTISAFLLCLLLAFCGDPDSEKSNEYIEPEKEDATDAPQKLYSDGGFAEYRCEEGNYIETYDARCDEGSVYRIWKDDSATCIMDGCVIFCCTDKDCIEYLAREEYPNESSFSSVVCDEGHYCEPFEWFATRMGQSHCQ
jgi:hypothetical protein